MRTHLNHSAIAAVLALSGLAASQAQAAFILDNWTLDGSGFGGIVVNNVDAMGFNDAPVNASYVDTNGDGVWNVGDTYRVQGKGTMGTLNSNESGVLNDGNLANDWELTFVFDLDVSVTGGTEGAFSWTHVAGSDVLDFYIQDIPPGKATPGDGTGYDDGQLVATFDAVAGQGGSANIAGTLDGSDDVTFGLSSLTTPGILLTADGTDLTVGTALALTDSNFDLDGDNDGVLNFTGGGFGCTAENQGTRFFCGQEDGTIRLADDVSIPEPATIALTGLGLIGMGFAGRRRKV